MRPLASLRIGHSTFEVWPDSLRTILPDGSQVTAAPEDTAAYRERARLMGYGDDTFRMSLDHELAHSLVADLLGLDESPALLRVAHGEGPTAETNLEEDAVLALQRFAVAAGVDLLSAAARHARRSGPGTHRVEMPAHRAAERD
jgi:hypothetical protein